MAINKLAKLNVSLYNNPLSQEKGSYIGKVQFNGSLNNEGIARKIVAQRSELRYETILSILNTGDEIKRVHLAQGHTVNDGLLHTYLTINGCFKGEGAKYDPAVHSIGIGVAPSPELSEFLSEVKVEVLGRATTGPVINKVTDLYTNTDNHILTPGGALKIFGKHIRICGNDQSKIGIWFIDAETGEQTKVSLNKIIDNKPSCLTLAMPQLSTGKYYLEIVTNCSTNANRQTKLPRTYRFCILLTIE